MCSCYIILQRYTHRAHPSCLSQLHPAPTLTQFTVSYTHLCHFRSSSSLLPSSNPLFLVVFHHMTFPCFLFPDHLAVFIAAHLYSSCPSFPAFVSACLTPLLDTWIDDYLPAPPSGYVCLFWLITCLRPLPVFGLQRMRTFIIFCLSLCPSGFKLVVFLSLCWSNTLFTFYHKTQYATHSTCGENIRWHVLIFHD